MKMKFVAVRPSVIGMAALLCRVAMVPMSQAAILTVDPGAVGGPSNDPLVAGYLLTPDDPVLDIVFADMKHVEVDKFGFQSLGPAIIDDAEYWLTDEFGIEIPGTFRAIGTFTDPGGVRFSFPPSIVAHDFHLGLVITDDVRVDVIVEGRVGVWGEIPEPSTFAIWSLLGLTVTCACRWRRKRVAQAACIRSPGRA